MSKTSIKFSITFIILFLFISCKQKEINEFNINGFDISHNESKIIFSIKKDSVFSLYEKNLKNGKINQIIKDSGNYIYPKFIDHNTFICLYFKKKSLNPSFLFIDNASNNIIKTFDVDNGFISDYTFSKEENKIYYIQAKEFDSYSPIAPKNFHNFEIFEIDLETKAIKQITNNKFYSLKEILDFNESKLLFSATGEPENSGLFLLDKNGNEISKINIINDTLRKSSMYFNPLIWKDNKIICASSYQLTMLNLNQMKETEILPSQGYHYSEIRNVKNRIYFKLNDDSNKIFIYDLENKKTTSINLTTL